MTHYLVRWRGHTPADDEWLLLEGALPGEGGGVRRRGPQGLAAAPPGPSPTPRPRLFQPLRRTRRHHSWRPPGFCSRLRQMS